MLETLVLLTVPLPFLAAALLFLLREKHLRNLLVTVMAGLLIASAIGLLLHGPFTLSVPAVFDSVVMYADFFLLFVILYYAWKFKSRISIWMTVFQIAALFWLDVFLLDHSSTVPAPPAFMADNLSLIMVGIINLVGSFIAIYALGYMKEHEEHLGLAKSRQPRFFFFFILFFGAMNGLVLANSLDWMYFFWETTTFCCVMLIAHDHTEIALKNAERALWMNVLGGVTFVSGLILLQKTAGTLYLTELFKMGPELLAGTGAVLVPLFLLVFTGFTKSAQTPFTGWLCGAMVAPTPVSALLHSSTMVKAGVYLVVRLAPLFAGTFLSSFVAVFGAFCFLATAALAVGQSNGKKVLAYSTISNLALIIACAGINTPASITAAILLIIFHAVSKALLFMCVGTIEQNIGSRDIEDMRGLYGVMPKTTVVALIGVLTMMLPPFGMLLAKWMAIESAAGQFLVIAMLAMGSALTVLFWARWAGALLSSPFKAAEPETLPVSVRLPHVVMAAGAVILSVAAPFIYTGLIEPVVMLYYKNPAYILQYGSFVSPTGVFVVYPLFILLGVGFILALRAAGRLSPSEVSEPYMCGAQIETGGKPGFVGPMKLPVQAASGNYYLDALFGEARLAPAVNGVAIVLLVVMLGGVL